MPKWTARAFYLCPTYVPGSEFSDFGNLLFYLLQNHASIQNESGSWSVFRWSAQKCPEHAAQLKIRLSDKNFFHPRTHSIAFRDHLLHSFLQYIPS
jgi:hypothetical protein